MEQETGIGAKNVGRNKLGMFIKGHKNLCKRRGVYRKCIICDNKFYAYPNSKKKYCSQRCVWDGKKGKKNNWGYKISLALKGVPKSKEHIKKVADANRGKKHPNICGKNHPQWKGGVNPINDTIRKSIEYKLWRDAVLARDNWTCQKTGQKGGKLVVHHINNFSKYPELRFAIDNGITLSLKSHKKFHRKYGIKNNTREQLNEFIK